MAAATLATGIPTNIATGLGRRATALLAAALLLGAAVSMAAPALADPGVRVGGTGNSAAATGASRAGDVSTAKRTARRALRIGSRQERRRSATRSEDRVEKRFDRKRKRFSGHFRGRDRFDRKRYVHGQFVLFGSRIDDETIAYGRFDRDGGRNDSRDGGDRTTEIARRPAEPRQSPPEASRPPLDPASPAERMRPRGATPRRSGPEVGERLPESRPFVSLDWRTYDLARPPEGLVYARLQRRVVLLDPATRRIVEEIDPAAQRDAGSGSDDGKDRDGSSREADREAGDQRAGTDRAPG